MDIKRLYEATKGNLTNEKVFKFLMKKEALEIKPGVSKKYSK